jgi:hypothetical protein
MHRFAVYFAGTLLLWVIWPIVFLILSHLPDTRNVQGTLVW